MAKVNKAFSLDPEVFILLDKYCRSHEEIGGKRKSRSAMVNEAIRWYLGDTANLINQRDTLQKQLLKRSDKVQRLEEDLKDAQDLIENLQYTVEKLQTVELETTVSKSPSLSWWRRLLLGR